MGNRQLGEQLWINCLSKEADVIREIHNNKLVYTYRTKESHMYKEIFSIEKCGHRLKCSIKGELPYESMEYLTDKVDELRASERRDEKTSEKNKLRNLIYNIKVKDALNL